MEVRRLSCITSEIQFQPAPRAPPREPVLSLRSKYMKLTTFYVNGAMRVIKGIGISVAPREACPKEILRGRGKRRQERGSSFVEFALVSLIFIPLFFGVLDYSRVFYYASVAQGAARAGTQYAVFSQPNETNSSAVQNAAASNGSSSGTTVTATA